MPVYKNDRAAREDAELEALEAEYRKEFGEPTEENEVVVPSEPPVVDKEEETWKKRHGDLRSYTSRQLNDKDKEILELQRQLKETERKGQQLPRNKEEATQWVKDYPDLARVLTTMIEEQTDIVREDVRTVREELENERQNAAEEKAVRKLLEKHEDFFTIRETPEFVEWVESQFEKRGERYGQMIFDSLYKNKTDAEAVIQTVNLYKADTKKVTTSRPDREAATKVARSTPSQPATNGGKGRQFSESEIEKMSFREYEKWEDEIDTARLEGRIIYDISGAAR